MELTEDDFKKEIVVSQTVEIDEMSEQLVKDLSKLAPFGMKNPKPIIHVKHIPSDIRQIGQQKNHLKMQFTSEHVKVDMIGFNKGDLFPYISQDTPVSAVGELGINEWNGNTTVQLIIEDMKIDEFQLFDYRGRKKWLDLKPFELGYNHLIVDCNHPETLTNENVITFEQTDKLRQVDLLIINSLPPTLDHLERVVKQTNPQSVLVSFEVEEGTFLQSLPSRADFTWLYRYIYKYETVDMKREIHKIMKLKQWSKENIIFMVQVFLDLQFVTATSGVITINKQAEKSDLTASPTYREKLTNKEIEKTLYFSSYTELKNIFLNLLNKQEVLKEEAVYGP